ncbi:hypothetical protein [Xanthomonas retroflexus]
MSADKTQSRYATNPQNGPDPTLKNKKHRPNQPSPTTPSPSLVSLRKKKR